MTYSVKTDIVTYVVLLRLFNSLFSRTTWVSWYQKGKTSLDLNEARDDDVLGCIGISWTLPSVLWHCWLGGRKSIRPVKTEWWGVGMVISLERGADLHMAQRMLLPLSLASVKSRLVLLFWYRITWVAPEKGRLNGRVWHQLDHMQTICIWLQTDNCTTPHHSIITGQSYINAQMTPCQLCQGTESIDMYVRTHTPV